MSKSLLCCKICGIKKKSLAKHIYKAHHISCEDYVNQILKIQRGVCKICDLPTKFISLMDGYKSYCSDICSSKDPEKNRKISKTVSSDECQSRTRSTCLSRYNKEFSFQSDVVRKKTKLTLLKRYGVDHATKSDLVKTKIKDTCVKRYGETNPGKVDSVKQKIKETFLKKYGFESHFKNKDISKKIQDHNIRKYGVPFKFQSKLFREEAMYDGKFKHKSYITKFGERVSYQTKPELRFIKRCENLNIPIMNGDEISYYFNGKDRRYFCDFKVKEGDLFRLIEIKNKHVWWYKDLASGKIKAKANAAILFSKNKGYLPYKIIFKS